MTIRLTHGCVPLTGASCGKRWGSASQRKADTVVESPHGDDTSEVAGFEQRSALSYWPAMPIITRDACNQNAMHRIVIAEDDPLTAGVYERILKNAGFLVVLASDGEEFLSRVASFKPDGVLVDLMLPKLPGIEAIKKLRNAVETANVQIVAITNAFIPKLVEAARSAGAAHVFSKSEITPAELSDIFKTLSSPPAKAA